MVFPFALDLLLLRLFRKHIVVIQVLVFYSFYLFLFGYAVLLHQGRNIQPVITSSRNKDILHKLAQLRRLTHDNCVYIVFNLLFLYP